MQNPENIRDFSPEFIFRTSRSSGSGGQRVNKVSTRVELLFYVDSSALLTDEEKQLIMSRLGTRIRSDGAIHIVSQQNRIQYINKKLVVERFYKIMEKALKPGKKRIPTVPPPKADEKRIKDKSETSHKKELRKKPGISG